MRRATFCGHARESACRSEIGQVTPVLEEVGAGEGNRTLVISLEGCMICRQAKGIAAKLRHFALNSISRLRALCKTVGFAIRLLETHFSPCRRWQARPVTVSG